MNLLKESWYFFVKNFLSAIYGIILIGIIYISKFFNTDILTRYDLIFVIVILLQLILIKLKIETKKEFFTIMIFHVVATVMEVFKTSSQIGSWKYPGVENSIFILGNVPLFTGFMYSAVGSYIIRASQFLKLKYTQYPKQNSVALLSIFIYINFFSHHYILDLRYILIIISIILFFKTYITFKVYKKVRKIHFLTSAFLTTIFIWVAENISTFYKIWLYPNQEISWQIVSLSKLTSWYLLLMVSFTIITTINRKNFIMK